MALNALPSAENITLLNGKGFFLKDGDTRTVSCGFMGKWSWTPNITTVEKKNGNSGTIETIKSRIQEITVDISAAFDEIGIRQIAMAMQGDVELIEQSAQTGVVVDAGDVIPGQLIDLGFLDVENVSITDGTDTLVAGSDYEVIPGAGKVLARTLKPGFVATFDVPEITAADDRNVIKILSQPEGIKGVFTIIGTNPDGEAYQLEHVRVELVPDGEISFISSDGDFQVIGLKGKGVRNTATPQYPWGKLTAMKRVG